MCSASYGDGEVYVAVVVTVAVVRSCCCDHNIAVIMTVACSDQHVMGGAVGAVVALVSCCAPQ